MKQIDLIPETIRVCLISLHDLDRDGWLQLEQWINETQEDFVKRFREDYVSLSEEDYQIVMLIRIGLSHKRIARIGNVALKSFKMRRFRIKQKMQIECAHLTEFLLNLYK